MIVVFVSSKGGAGKSTLAVSLAVEWAQQGLRVLVLDADPQGTSLAWSGVRAAAELAGPTVLAVGDNVRSVLVDVASDYDLIIVDTAGRQSKRVIAALREADVAVLPCLPGGPDVWALAETVETVREVQEIRPELRAGITVNCTTSTNLSKSASDAIADLGVPVLATVGRRTAIAEAVTAGQSVVEREPTSIAANEIRDLARAIAGRTMRRTRRARVA